MADKHDDKAHDAADKADAAKSKHHEPVSGEKDFDPTKRPGYQEYPKVIQTPHGTMTVNSKEDEDAAMKTGKA